MAAKRGAARGREEARGPALREPGAAARRRIVEALLDFYRSHRRDLPWRKAGDPYAVWVSEVMLQQTQVATVRSYYERWMKRFPTVSALARAEEADVLHAWQGLGYYSRARNLKRAAEVVLRVHDGVVPRTPDALLSLPGVGPYSAGAIASIAYGERAPIVDGNVVRVLCRLFGLRGDPAKAPLKAHLWKLALDLVPEGAPGDFNQAMMELGATVCTPRRPLCEGCPLSRDCVALAENVVDRLPESAERARVEAVLRIAVVLRSGKRVLVAQVPEGARRWAGMWEFPNDDVADGETSLAGARRVARRLTGAAARKTRRAVTVETAPVFVVRHSVTGYRITLEVFGGKVGAPNSEGAGRTARWVTAEQLDELAMPAAHRRIARFVQARS